MQRKIICSLLAIILLLCAGCGTDLPHSENGDDSSASDSGNNTTIEIPTMDRPEDHYSNEQTINSLSSTDAVGRFFDSYGDMDSEKYVGIFYFLWTGQHGSASEDISKLSLEEIKKDTNVGVHHYWTEPLYGYYNSEDPWVFRKHLEILAMAGVDYIAFDVTNSYPYVNVLNNILPVALELQNAGFKIPKLMFYCNAGSANVAETLYNNFYSDDTYNGELYADLWFRAGDTNNANSENKPWIVVDQEFYSAAKEEVKNFFYKKDSQWPNVPMKDNGMPWMSWAGREDGYRQYNHNGIMSVSIAQHTSGAFSDAVLMDNRSMGHGRGWSRNDNKNDESRIRNGSNFQEQWDYAVSQENVNNIFITGWNEWVAQKQHSNSSRSTAYFVDLFNEEFSRDAEMTKGLYGDNFLMQIAQNIRAFKGIPSSGKKQAYPTSIDIRSKSVEQWKGTEAFTDFTGDIAPRDYKSSNFSLPHYVNDTGRNDIELTRVTYDADNVYFLVKCADNVTAYENGDKTWMNILLEVDGLDNYSSWENYQFVINRTVNGNKSSVENLKSDGSSVKIGEADIAVNGKYLAVSVPRKVLGLTKTDFCFRFKVADHVVNYTDIMDYYVNGDSAPIGRFNYTFKTKY